MTTPKSLAETDQGLSTSVDTDTPADTKVGIIDFLKKRSAENKTHPSQGQKGSASDRIKYADDEAFDIISRLVCVLSAELIPSFEQAIGGDLSVFDTTIRNADQLLEEIKYNSKPNHGLSYDAILDKHQKAIRLPSQVEVQIERLKQAERLLQSGYKVVGKFIESLRERSITIKLRIFEKGLHPFPSELDPKRYNTSFEYTSGKSWVVRPQEENPRLLKENEYTLVMDGLNIFLQEMDKIFSQINGRIDSLTKVLADLISNATRHNLDMELFRE